MKKVYKYPGGEWIDLYSPTHEEAREAVIAAGIEASAIEELLAPSLKHKIQFNDSHAYIVLHFPAFKESENGDAAYEVDFILTKNVIITTHYEEIEALEKFREAEESENGIFFGILGELLTNFEHKLSSVDHWIREIENKMFSGKEKQTIIELSEVSRHLIDFRKITAVYPDVFQTMVNEGSKLFGKRFIDLSKETIERFNKAQSKLEILSDTARELRETNNSLLSTKQNASMKTLTVVTAVATVIVGAALIWIGLQTIK